MSAHKTRIMYIECKAGGLDNVGRIGRVTFSKSGKSLSYGGQTFHSLGGQGFKANYADEEGVEYWISGPRKDGADGLYGRVTVDADVDEDVREEYWRDIRSPQRR